MGYLEEMIDSFEKYQAHNESLESKKKLSETKNLEYEKIIAKLESLNMHCLNEIKELKQINDNRNRSWHHHYILLRFWTI